MNNTFKFVMPAELEKAKDGNWKIRGLASTEVMDQQGETILQRGMDLTPIDKKKGIINFDHGKGPENMIGLLDGYSRGEKGLYIEGRLFKNHSRAKAVQEVMSSLGEGDTGRAGLSVEGVILERDPTNHKIIKKCRINAVAVTFSPVNQDTYADLVKSMSCGNVEFDSQETVQNENISDSEVTFTTAQVMAMMQKALGAGAAGLKAPADRSGGEALAQEDMDKDPIPMALQKKKKKLKKMSKNMYKSNMLNVLGKLKVLYPNSTPSELWEAVRERLEATFPDIKESFGKGRGPDRMPRKRKGSGPLNGDHAHHMEKIDSHLRTMHHSDLHDLASDIASGNGENISDHDKSDLRDVVKDHVHHGVKNGQWTAKNWKKDVLGKGIRIKQVDPKEREHKLYEEARQRSDYGDNKGKNRAQLAQLARESGADKKAKDQIRAQADAAIQEGEDRSHVRPGVGT